VKRDPPEKRRYGPPKTKTVALPMLPPAVIMPRRQSLSAYAVAASGIVISGIVISTPSGITPVST
jgi:hypothetical protein